MNHTKTTYIQITSKCRACWECVKSCPNQVLGKVNLPFHKHAHINKTTDCTGCLKCVKTCSVNAITPIIKFKNINTMKKTLNIIMALFLLVISSQEINAQKFDSDDIIGKWYTEDKGAIVLIYKKNNGKYYGKSLWFIDEKDKDGNLVKDKKNPYIKLRNRTIKGMEFIIGFIYNDGAYEDGTIYNSKDGNTYSATMKLSSINTLEVRGYLLFEWLGKTVVWTRKK